VQCGDGFGTESTGTLKLLDCTLVEALFEFYGAQIIGDFVIVLMQLNRRFYEGDKLLDGGDLRGRGGAIQCRSRQQNPHASHIHYSLLLRRSATLGWFHRRGTCCRCGGLGRAGRFC
jgi:hypothetical protein